MSNSEGHSYFIYVVSTNIENASIKAIPVPDMLYSDVVKISDFRKF